MIPGILGCDQKAWAKHGTIDNMQTINFDKEFNEKMKEICKCFNLSEEISYQDKQGKIFTMAGPLDVKGVRGYDSRMFIYDLMRLSPRDLNYVEDKNSDPKKKLINENFVLRNE